MAIITTISPAAGAQAECPSSSSCQQPCSSPAALRLLGVAVVLKQQDCLLVDNTMAWPPSRAKLTTALTLGPVCQCCRCRTGSADNTRAALHFATAAARVVMRPQLNRVASSKAVIKAMASEIQQLKAKLVSNCTHSECDSCQHARSLAGWLCATAAAAGCMLVLVCNLAMAL
jgi:hypothetical protein